MTTRHASDSCDAPSSLSPARKRARYDPEPDLSNDETPSPDVGGPQDDRGVGRLDYELDYPPSDDDTVFSKGDCRQVNASCVSMSPEGKERQACVLEQVLSRDTAQRLSAGEWGDFLIKRRPFEPGPAGKNPFDRLPDELVLAVLRCLPKKELALLGRTCRRFRRLMEDESLWTRMDLSNLVVRPGDIGMFLGRQIFIFRLARSKIMWPPISPNSKADQPNFQSNVMYLDLSMAEVSPQSLETIFGKMRRLRKISLENVTVTNEVLIALSHNSNLEVANLPMVMGIGRRGIQHFLTGCRQLRELNMAWTYLNSPCISTICENLPNTLDRLNLSGCRRYMCDSHVTSLVNNCPRLRELDLSDCTALTTRSIRRLTTLGQLNFLSLSRCYTITHRDLMALKHLESLQYLDVHGSFVTAAELDEVQRELGTRVTLNKFKFTSIARPTVGLRRSSIWNLRAHD